MKINTRPYPDKYSIKEIKNFLAGIFNSTILKDQEKQNIDAIMQQPDVDLHRLWYEISNLHNDRKNGVEVDDNTEISNCIVDAEDNVIFVDF